MNAKPRVAFLSSRMDWISLQILILFVFTIVYTVIIWQNESTKGQTELDTFRATVAAVVTFSHFALVSILGTFELGGLIMLFFFHKMEQATKQGIEQGIEQGREEGIEQGREEGRSETHRAWTDWNTRRQEAEAKGIPFNELPPAMPQNGAGK